MPADGVQRRAAVVGANRPLGAEIVVQLEKDGYLVAVVDDADALARDAAPLDAFVFNATLEKSCTRFGEVSEADFEAALEWQLYALVACGQAAMGRLSHGGAIVHVGSRSHLGAWGGAHLAATGAAMVAMGRCMALEFAASGVRVNTVATDFAGEAWDTTQTRADVAKAVSFLAGPQSRLISGETILLNQTASLCMAEAERR